MILDGDLSVLPEDLPKFHRGLVDGRAELVNGSRLVYDMEPGAMRFLNMIGNRIFARLLKGIIGQQVKDTLCGTKVLLKRRLRPDRRRSLVLRRVRPVRRLRPALRRGEARPEDRRPAGALPPADVRRDEHQPLAPRGAAAPDDGLRVLEVQGRAADTPRSLSRTVDRLWSERWAVLAAAAVVAVAVLIVVAQPLRSPWWTYADADASYTASALNLLLGEDVTFVDHPGLPLTEALAITFGAETLIEEGSLSESRAARVRRPLAARPRRDPLGLPRLLRARLPARCAALVPLRGAALRPLDVGARGRAALGGRARPDGDVDPAPPRRPARRSDARVRVHGRPGRRTALAGVVRRGCRDRRLRDDGQAARARAAACARRRRALEAGGRA